MSLFQLVLSFEKRGHLDLKIHGSCHRSPCQCSSWRSPRLCHCDTSVTFSVQTQCSPSQECQGDKRGRSHREQMSGIISVFDNGVRDSWVFVCGAFGFSFKAFVVGLFLVMGFAVQPHSPGMRHYAREKVVGPAKPLWFAKGSIVLEPKTFYQVA